MKRYTLSVSCPEYCSELHDALMVVSNQDGIPDRKIICSDCKEHSPTRGTFDLTEEEATEIGNHPHVEWIELSPTDHPGFSTAGGNFTVNAGVTTVIDTFNINTNTKLSEYTVHLENVNGNIQSQKVLVMNYGAGIGLTAYSSEYGIMFHPNQIADIGVVVTSGICSLTATTKSGITGITTFSLTRQDQS